MVCRIHLFKLSKSSSFCHLLLHIVASKGQLHSKQLNQRYYSCEWMEWIIDKIVAFCLNMGAFWICLAATIGFSNLVDCEKPSILIILNDESTWHCIPLAPYLDHVKISPLAFSSSCFITAFPPIWLYTLIEGSCSKIWRWLSSLFFKFTQTSGFIYSIKCFTSAGPLAVNSEFVAGSMNIDGLSFGVQAKSVVPPIIC